METIQGAAEIIKSFSPLTIGIAIIVYMLNAAINDFNVTNIEMKLMKPKRKFTMIISKYAIPSALLSTITIFLSIADIRTDFDENKLGDVISFTNYLIIMLLMLFFIILITLYFTYYLLKAMEFTLGINYDYYVEDEEGSWLVLRNNSQDIIVTQMKNRIKFFENPYNHEYIKKVTSAEWKKVRYENETNVKRTYYISFGLALVIFIISVILKLVNWMESLTLLWFIVLSVFLAIAGVIILSSKADFDHFESTINRQGEDNTSS